MHEIDMAMSSDVLILGAPRAVIERYGGRMHRFSGEFREAVRFAVAELPHELADYTVIHAADGHWFNAREIQEQYRHLARH